VIKYPRIAVFMLAIAAAAAVAGAQEKEKPSPAPAKPPTPIKVQVVIGRYEGDKKISSMPYTLATNGGRTATLRIGSKIPTMYSPNAAAAKDGSASINYQDVGTNIDCQATELENGRFALNVSIDDSSVYPDDKGSAGTKTNPSFRAFKAQNAIVLRNGETGQLLTATDKVTGETVRVDVTLTVLK
jgi:Flp pilus assembly secretin CpaC